MKKKCLQTLVLTAILTGTTSLALGQDSFSWDVDGDGKQTPLTDGLLVIRYLFGFTGPSLIQGAVDDQALRQDPTAISAYLDDNQALLDVDGDGKAAPLSDGLIVIRYLFGFSGESLIQNALTQNASRTTSNLIEAYLASHSTESSGNGGNEPTPQSKTLFETDISALLLSRCLGCHYEGGPATATPLRYVPQSDPDYLTKNYDVLVNYITANTSRGETLLAKASGGTAHGGGPVLDSSKDEYAALSRFVDLVTEEKSAGENDSEPVSNAHTTFFKSSKLLAADATLRRATMLLLGRNPSPAERDRLGEGASQDLRAAIRMATQSPEFHEFLIRGANDRLLTDAFVEGIPIEQASIEGNGFYPLGTNAHANAQAKAGERFFHWPKYNHWRWGLARAPLELIAHIVDNDLDYREVLTADYTMMNYAVNDFLNGGAEFDPVDPETFTYCQSQPDEPCYDHRQFKPAKNKGQSLLTEDLQVMETEFQSQRITQHADFIQYPHAGVLNTQAFLNRYPSTETNRNRARARWTFYHFLGIDIEKSAPRTTDPVALADTDNPTLKNPACTVCHQVLDPVAGAFQHYGDVGYYNESWGGLDALPHNYKSAVPDPAQSPTFIDGKEFVVDNEAFGPVFETTFDSPAQTVYIRVEFTNDFADEGGDRNAFFDSLTLEGPSQSLTIEFENLPDGWRSHGCGGPQWQAYGQYCPGGVVFPVDLDTSGECTLQLKLRGEQYGGDPVRVMVSVDSDALGPDALRYAEGDTWYKDMRQPGFLSSTVTTGEPSLQWLADQLVKDPWFAEAAIKFWWPSLMGAEVVAAPEVLDDEQFDSKLALYEAQQSYIEDLAGQFSAGIAGGAPFNGRDLIVELLVSPWFRLIELAEPDVAATPLGGRRLLTPEELEAKFQQLSGFYWGDSNNEFQEWHISGRYTRLTEEFQILYGGIDSRNVTKRTEQMTPLMFNIAEKLALETACEIVIRDFQTPPEARRVLKRVDALTTPERTFLAGAQADVPSASFDTVIELSTTLSAGEVSVHVSFVNDFGDEYGDRNARFDQLVLVAPDGTETIIEFESPPSGTQINGCGHTSAAYHQLSCNGNIEIPIPISVSGSYAIRLVAAGEQYGDEPVKVALALTHSDSGEPRLKAQIVDLHHQLLGEVLTIDHEEITATYELLQDSFVSRKSEGLNRVDEWPNQSCPNHAWRDTNLNGEDPSYMKGSWINVLTYLMTDFRFLHE